jgi:CheY-like chemotaxis protein
LPQQVTVLVVEDEILIAAMIADALESGGYEVHHEATGECAIAALDGTLPFSGLITDIRLADQVTGWDVAHHARRLDPNIAVLYVSGDSHHQYEAEGVPNSTFLQKPFAADQVTTAISSLLNAASS